MMMRKWLQGKTHWWINETVFWGLSFFLIGGLIAREATFVPFEAVLGALVLFWGLLYFNGGRVRPPLLLKAWLGLLMAFFVLSTLPLIVHAFSAEDILTSEIPSRFEIHTHLIFIALWVLLAFHFTQAIVTVWKWLILSSVWVLWVLVAETLALKGSTDVGAFLLSHRFGDYASSYFIDFGIYANTLFLFLLGALFWQKRLGVIWSSLLWLALVITFAGALLSQSRTAWIGWPEALIGWSLFYGFWFWQHVDRGAKIKWMVFGSVSAVVIGWALVSSGFVSVVEQRVNAAQQDVKRYVEGDPFTSLGARFVMYEAGWQSLRDQPLWGVGPDGFDDEIQLQTAKVLEGRFQIPDRSFSYGNIHNQFLMSAMLQGVLGVLAVVLVFVFLFYAFFIRKSSQEKDAQKALRYNGAIVTVASLLTFMPETPLNDRVQFLYFFLMMSLAVVMVAIGEKEAQM